MARDVVKNTGTKLAHRLVSNEDREDLGGAMLMGGAEIQEIARLSPGEAYLYTEGLYRPRRVRCLHSNAYLGLEDKETPIGAELLPYVEKEAWFSEVADSIEQRARAMLRNLADLQERISIEVRSVSNRLVALFARWREAAELGDLEARKAELRGIKEAIVADRDKLARLMDEEYLAKAVKPQLPELEALAQRSVFVKEHLGKCVDAHSSLIKPDYDGLLANLRKLERNAELALEEISNEAGEAEEEKPG